MNGIFPLIFIVCALWFLLFAPESFLPALLAGGQSAAALSLSLLAIYAAFLGLTQVMEDCGLNKKLSRLLRRPVNKLFGTTDEQASEYICLNLSANMLGIGGVATPLGIRAAERLQSLPNARYTHSMLFTLNATSVQLLPTTVLALLTSYGAKNPSAIVLPSLLSTALSTALGILLVKIFIRKDKKDKAP